MLLRTEEIIYRFTRPQFIEDVYLGKLFCLSDFMYW